MKSCNLKTCLILYVLPEILSTLKVLILCHKKLSRINKRLKVVRVKSPRLLKLGTFATSLPNGMVIYSLQHLLTKMIWRHNKYLLQINMLLVFGFCGCLWFQTYIIVVTIKFWLLICHLLWDKLDVIFICYLGIC